MDGAFWYFLGKSAERQMWTILPELVTTVLSSVGSPLPEADVDDESVIFLVIIVVIGICGAVFGVTLLDELGLVCRSGV